MNERLLIKKKIWSKKDMIEYFKESDKINKYGINQHTNYLKEVKKKGKK